MKRTKRSSTGASDVIAAILTAAGGRIPDCTVARILRSKGIGTTNEQIASVRRNLGFPGYRKIGKPAAEVEAVAKASGALPPSVEATDPSGLTTPYLRACVEEWNRRVEYATALLDLATDPLRAKPQVRGMK